MKKPNPLMAGLQQFDRKGAVSRRRLRQNLSQRTRQTRARAVKTRSREGAVQIAAFFPEDVRTQLKVLAAEQRREVQDLMAKL